MKKALIIGLALMQLLAFTSVASAEDFSKLGVQLESGIKQYPNQGGYITYVNRSELPPNVRDFKLIEVQTQFTKPEAENNSISFAGIGPYDDTNGYSSGVPSPGHYYPVVVLFDINKHPLGFYVGEINVQPPVEKLQQSLQDGSSNVPEIQDGVVHTPTWNGFTTTITRSKLPIIAKNFTRIRVMSSNYPLYIKEHGGLELFTGFSDPYKESGYNSGLPQPGKYYVLTILYDDNKKVLAYREDIVNTSEGKQQPNPPQTSKPSTNDPNQYGSDIDPNYNKQEETPLFSDVDSQYWALTAIKELNKRNVLSGYPDGKFRPEKVVTRAEFAKIMVLAAGLSPTKVTSTSFSDIKSTDWYAPFIEAAKDYLNGYTLSDGSLIYDPDAPALREDIAVAIVKLKGYNNTRLADRSIIQAMFKDYDSISNYAKDYVSLAVEYKLVSGFPDETFKAQLPITRSQAAAMLWRAYQYGNDNKDGLQVKVKVPLNEQIPSTVTGITYTK